MYNVIKEDCCIGLYLKRNISKKILLKFNHYLRIFYVDLSECVVAAEKCVIFTNKFA